MTRAIPDRSLARLSRFISDQMGLRFPQERFSDLERGLIHAATASDFEDVKAFVDWLLSSSHRKKQIEILARHLTIGETYFFRDRNMFQVLETDVFPELIRRARSENRHLRIWSAACSSGEEPYSIAILLHKLIPDIAGWHITILATDINPEVLKKAETAVYKEWSFRDTPKWVREHYFACENGTHYRIAPRIRNMVTFCRLNLAGDSYPAAGCNTHGMDFIFCRNVLMYFDPERARSVVEKLHRSLVDGGWLAVSPCEISHEVFKPFQPVSFDGAMIYRKRGADALTDGHSGQPDPAAEPFIRLGCNSSPLGADSPPVETVFPVEPPAPSTGKQEKEPETIVPEADDFARALMLYDQGRYAEAAGILADIVSEGGEPEPMLLLARSLSNQGRLDEARKWCEKAAALDKLNPDLHYLQAVILHELGRMDEAILSLKRALYLDPDFVLAHFVLATIHRSAGRIKESEKSYQNALELLNRMDPDRDFSGSDGLTAGRLREMILSACSETADG